MQVTGLCLGIENAAEIRFFQKSLLCLLTTHRGSSKKKAFEKSFWVNYNKQAPLPLTNHAIAQWCTIKADSIYLPRASLARICSENIGHVIIPKG